MGFDPKVINLVLFMFQNSINSMNNVQGPRKKTLRQDREVILERIAGYHRLIDGCTAEMSKYKLCIIWNDR